MNTNTRNDSKINSMLSITLLLSMLFICIPKAQAEYPCPLSFYYVVNEGCVPNYNTYSNVVWGTTVVPTGYSYYNGSTYNAADVHGYYPATNGYHYNDVGHYNAGGPNYYHNNWGGGAYHRR